MEFKGTKGEWKVDPFGSSNGIIDSNQAYNVQCLDNNGDYWSICAVWRDSVGSPAANAKLIAAAPDLLEALQDLLEQQNDAPLERYRSDWEKAMINAQKAIEKALK